MGPGKRWIALLVVVLGAGAALAPSALGGGRSNPIAGIACKRVAPGVCQDAGPITVPPNGDGSQKDNVPSKATAASAFLEPLNPAELATFDSTWEDVVYAYPNLSKVTSTPVRRAVTCAILARASAAIVASSYKVQEQGQLQGNDLFATFLSICIQVTVLAQQQTAATAAGHAASAGCAQANVAVPFLVSRTRSVYRFQLVGRTSKASGSGPLAVSCRAKGNGIQVSIKPRSRHQKLRQVVGPNLRVGFANPTKRSLIIQATYRYSGLG
jgi:hypothetical protein